MSTYCTTTSLDTLMVTTSFDSATTALAGQVITWSENEINKTLSERYNVTGWTAASVTPPHVKTLCEWLSLGYLYEAMSRGSKDQYTRSDRYLLRAKSNMKDIIDNKINLVNTAGSAIADLSTRRTVLTNTDSYTQTFDEDNPLNWKVDSDKLNDIETDRT